MGSFLIKNSQFINESCCYLTKMKDLSMHDSEQVSQHDEGDESTL